jgi:SAM-dependent methyltransferase
MTRLPISIRQAMRTTRALGNRAVHPVRWGNLRRTQPFSLRYGYDRGRPVDRVYVDRFIHQHRADIAGSTIELLDGFYARLHGGSSLTSLEVLDIDRGNKSATLIADLGIPDSLPEERYDCFILTQTLHLVQDTQAALLNCWRSLKPGGVLLITIPSLAPLDRHYGPDTDYWRPTPKGLEDTLKRVLGVDAKVQAYGNLLTCVATMFGLSSEELRAKEIDQVDPHYPVVTGARLVKRS